MEALGGGSHFKGSAVVQSIVPCCKGVDRRLTCDCPLCNPPTQRLPAPIIDTCWREKNNYNHTKNYTANNKLPKSTTNKYMKKKIRGKERNKSRLTPMTDDHAGKAVGENNETRLTYDKLQNHVCLDTISPTYTSPLTTNNVISTQKSIQFIHSTI